MANQNGAKYGFTGLFPVVTGKSVDLRKLLRSLDNTQTYPRGSPLSHVPIIHMARLFVIDRFAYQGTPAKVDTLKSDYLVLACDFDGDSVDTLIQAMLDNIPNVVAAIWNHCVGFPGIHGRDALSEYFERCQVNTTLLLADQPLATVDRILMGLLCRRRLNEFIRQVQRKPRNPAALQRGFKRMWRDLQRERPLAGDL